MTALEHLDPRTLRDLAGAIEARDPSNIARSELTPEGLERLADIYLAGSQPTIGFWRRYRRTGDAEVRIGELLGPATVGAHSSATEGAALTKDDRHDFRQMAAHPDVVEDEIAKSTDEVAA